MCSGQEFFDIYITQAKDTKCWVNIALNDFLHIETTTLALASTNFRSQGWGLGANITEVWLGNKADNVTRNLDALIVRYDDSLSIDD